MVFVVQQVSPVCRRTYRFTVKGQRGVNRIRFPGRASKLRLDPGTYQITARTPSGGFVRKLTLVVVDGNAATREQVAVARASNLCSSAGKLASAAGATGASNTSNLSSPFSAEHGSSSSARPSASGPTLGSNSHSGAVLGSTVEKAAKAIRPLLVALLGLAIVLLAVASLPRVALTETRANYLLMRHRTEIAGLGAVAFVAVLIAFLSG